MHSHRDFSGLSNAKADNEVHFLLVPLHWLSVFFAVLFGVRIYGLSVTKSSLQSSRRIVRYFVGAVRIAASVL